MTLQVEKIQKDMPKLIRHELLDVFEDSAFIADQLCEPIWDKLDDHGFECDSDKDDAIVTGIFNTAYVAIIDQINALLRKE